MVDGQGAEGVRLQKVLANAGVASRRVSEQLIVEGRVRVNGQVVTELGSRIDPEHDLVDVDGVAVQLDAGKRYVMLNKPTGVISSMKDDRGRTDLRAFTKDWDERLFNVGRLDYDTSGLLVLTNDGELAQVLAHPSFGEFTLRRVEGVLPLDVEQAGGDLPVTHADRVAILLDQQHAILIVERDDRHGAGVLDVVPHEFVVVVTEAILADIPDVSLEDAAGVYDVDLERLVAQVHVRRSRPRRARSRGGGRRRRR